MMKYTKKALELDENLYGGYHLLALTKVCFEHNHEECERNYRRALELNPNDTMTLTNYGIHNIVHGNFDFAKKLTEIGRAHV